MQLAIAMPARSSLLPPTTNQIPSPPRINISKDKPILFPPQVSVFTSLGATMLFIAFNWVWARFASGCALPTLPGFAAPATHPSLFPEEPCAIGGLPGSCPSFLSCEGRAKEEGIVHSLRRPQPAAPAPRQMCGQSCAARRSMARGPQLPPGAFARSSQVTNPLLFHLPPALSRLPRATADTDSDKQDSDKHGSSGQFKVDSPPGSMQPQLAPSS